MIFKPKSGRTELCAWICMAFSITGILYWWDSLREYLEWNVGGLFYLLSFFGAVLVSSLLSEAVAQYYYSPLTEAEKEAQQKASSE